MFLPVLGETLPTPSKEYPVPFKEYQSVPYILPFYRSKARKGQQSQGGEDDPGQDPGLQLRSTRSWALGKLRFRLARGSPIKPAQPAFSSPEPQPLSCSSARAREA